MSERLTPDRLDAVRIFLRSQWLYRDGESALDYARELLSELDAVMRERDEAMESAREWRKEYEHLARIQ